MNRIYVILPENTTYPLIGDQKIEIVSALVELGGQNVSLNAVACHFHVKANLG